MHRIAFAAILWTGTAAAADPPTVVADIPPVHSLVTQVMEGVGEPVLLLDGSASPHHGSLRPSQARALAQADAVFWIGHGLTPWLEETIEQGDATSLALLEWPATVRLPLREDMAANDDHDHDHDHGHDEEVTDPHAWLDPQNAILWLGEIAATLGEIDPRNAAQYGANARAAMAEIKALSARIDARLDPHEGASIAVAHDAFHYFEDRFGLSAVAALSPGDDVREVPSRIRAVGTALKDGTARCLLAEPGGRMPDRLVAGTTAKVVRLDPLGSSFDPGPDLYVAMLDRMATAVADCLSEGSG